MKIFHCADLHFGASLSGFADKRKSIERGFELLGRFGELVDLAKKEQVKAVLIAGDLFDTSDVSEDARKYVYSVIEQAEEIDFYYVNGNHDAYFSMELPNFHTFSSNCWTEYDLDDAGKIRLYGRSLSDHSEENFYKELSLPENGVNLVMLHGQALEVSFDAAKEDTIPLKELANKHIDYLALGHIHSYREWKIDGRCKAVYAGTLEGRGFDEQGDHGFVCLDISENGLFESKFIPFARRKIYVEEFLVDLSQLSTDESLLSMRDDILDHAAQKGIESKDYFRMILKGSRPWGMDSIAGVLEQLLSKEYYVMQVVDETIEEERDNRKTKKNHLLLEEEFLRLVYNDASLSEEQRQRVAKLGQMALRGEDL